MDVYEKLKKATKEDLLKAVIKFYLEDNPDCEKYIRLGYAIAQKDGWMQVAPAWLEDTEKW